MIRIRDLCRPQALKPFTLPNQQGIPSAYVAELVPRHLKQERKQLTGPGCSSAAACPVG